MALAEPDAYFLRAAALHEQGDVEQAERLYLQVVAAQPDHGDALSALGVIALQRGAALLAIDALVRAVQAKPHSALAFANLGNALLQREQHDDALLCYERALSLEPEFSGARYNRGSLLMAMQRNEEALDDFRCLLQQKPDDADALNNCGLALLRLKRPLEALERFEKALHVQPGYSAFLTNQALTLLQLNRPADTLSVCDGVLTLDPNDVEASICRADALLDLLRFEDAVGEYQRALGLDPNHSRALTNLAGALLQLNKPATALAASNRALALEPRDAQSLNTRGVSLLRLGSLQEALASFDKSLTYDANAADVVCNKGDVLQQLHRYDEAAQCFVRVHDLEPEREHVLGRGLHARLLSCDWAQYQPATEHILAAIRAGTPADVPFSFLSVPATPADQLTCARLYSASQHRGIQSQDMSGVRYRHERVRVAYLSADFREHPVAQLAATLLAQHDRERFEIVGVSLQPYVECPVAERFRSACDGFIEVSTLSDAEATARLRELEIDIAVDLTGYTTGERSGILARRVAPVQVNYLGYAGTMGASFIDYLIADHTVVPTEQESAYSESIVRLPGSYFPADWHNSLDATVPSREEAGLPAHAFVFCAFNSPYKISPAVFDVWMRLLRQTPDSVLWLRSMTSAAVTNLRREAAQRYIDPERLIFASRVTTQEQHLARYALADLFLDTAPYNAHTTAMEALRAGVPVVTASGSAFASRVAASLLHSIGIPELAARDLQEYETLALQLASNPQRLTGLQDRLKQELRGAIPLSSYCRHLESAYLRMHVYRQQPIVE